MTSPDGGLCQLHCAQLALLARPDGAPWSREALEGSQRTRSRLPRSHGPRSHGQGVKALTVETGKAAFTDSTCGPRLHTEIAHGIVWELFERNEIDGHSRCVGEEEV